MKAKIFSTIRVMFVLGLLVISALAAGLNVGDRAPNFTLLNTDNKAVSLTSIVGEQKATVLVFYRTQH